jgi:hypothetical protein
MPDQTYSVNDVRKDFMINQNENDLCHPGIKPGSPYLQSQSWSIFQETLKEVYNDGIKIR